MSRKIRIGNDISVAWTLIDQEGEPYILEGRDVSIELELMNQKKFVKIKEITTVANTVNFIFYGKDQKYAGHYHLKFIENNKEVEMVTFDIQDAFQLVEHSWLAADSGQEPDRVEIESLVLTSTINSSVGPAAGFGEVTATVDDNVGTPSVVVETSGPNSAKNISFAFHNIKGEPGRDSTVPGPPGPTGGVYWPEIYVDSDMHLHIVEPTESLGTRLYIQDGWLYAIN